jgi:hypothetical protein
MDFRAAIDGGSLKRVVSEGLAELWCGSRAALAAAVLA